jgi:hypothetical protein
MATGKAELSKMTRDAIKQPRCFLLGLNAGNTYVMKNNLKSWTENLEKHVELKAMRFA